MDVQAWTLIGSGQNCPQQNNGSDCGMFTCTTADYIAAGIVPDYAQVDIPFFRLRMCLSILQKKIVWFLFDELIVSVNSLSSYTRTTSGPTTS